MKSFKEYLEEGVAKKITPDTNRAEHLTIEAERKLRQLRKSTENQGVDDENANDYVEYCYNILIFLVRARMLRGGFNSAGRGAHEAEVAYAANLGLNTTELKTLDQLRYFRNGILYYGKQFDREYAQKIIDFTFKLTKKLK